jgi:hypothetical protein
VLGPRARAHPDFITFIKGLLEYDPAKRLTPLTALNHRFLSRTFPFSLIYSANNAEKPKKDRISYFLKTLTREQQQQQQQQQVSAAQAPVTAAVAVQQQLVVQQKTQEIKEKKSTHTRTPAVVLPVEIDAKKSKDAMVDTLEPPKAALGDRQQQKSPLHEQNTSRSSSPLAYPSPSTSSSSASSASSPGGDKTDPQLGQKRALSEVSSGSPDQETGNGAVVRKSGRKRAKFVNPRLLDSFSRRGSEN